MSRAARFRILFWNPATALMSRASLASLGDRTVPCWVCKQSFPSSSEGNALREARSTGCASGLGPLTLYFACGDLFFPAYSCSKGLESEAKKTGHCQVHGGEMGAEQLSAGEGQGGGE